MAKVGFWLLVGTEVLSVLVSVVMMFSPFTVLSEPRFRQGAGDLLIRGWGITWLLLSVAMLVVLSTAFRQRQRWAFFVLGAVPLLWLAHFLLNRETVHNLALAVVTGVALAATYPWFFQVARKSRAA